MGVILFVGILSLLTAGAFLYAFFLNDSPVTGLWMCCLQEEPSKPLAAYLEINYFIW